MNRDQLIIKQFKLYHAFKLIDFTYNINRNTEIIKYYQYFWKNKHSVLFMIIKLVYVLFLSSFNNIGKILLKRYIIIFIVYYHNKIIGLAHMEFNGRRRYQDASLGIVLNKEVTGIGLGRKLMQACVDYCIKNNKRKVELDVFTDNVHAISLYKKIGFTVTNTKNSEYHMELKLGALVS